MPYKYDEEDASSIRSNTTEMAMNAIALQKQRIWKRIVLLQSQNMDETRKKEEKKRKKEKKTKIGE